MSSTIQLLLLAACFATLVCGDKQHQYCIIGGGPSGIQLGHFFLRAGRDYVIFERAPRAGSFFEVYPRQRKLISLNKRNVKKDKSAEFAFRHDWNTLIDERCESNRTKPVTLRSKELFPDADILAEYLREFAEEQAQHIRYNSQVTKVSRKKDSSGGFDVNVGSELFQCKDVILATGFYKARDAEGVVDGLDLTEQYGNTPMTGEQYEGKSVYVLGQGNAAMETVQELQKYTSEVHLYSRGRELPQGGKGVRMAHETHYVGDIRAGRTGLLDTYLLKSLDTFCHDCLHEETRIVIIPCQGGRKCIWQASDDDCIDEACKIGRKKGIQNQSYELHVANWPASDSKAKHIREKMKELNAKEGEDFWIKADGKKQPVHNELPEETAEEMSDEKEYKAKLAFWKKMSTTIDFNVFDDNWEDLMVDSMSLRRNPKLADFVAELRPKGGHDPERFPMDHVIVAFGWVMDTDLFDDALKAEIAMTHRRKYPALTPMFQVKSTDGKPVDGLYAAGTISHGLDFRKSAGGFIHGFRYTARALFRHLEEKNFGNTWPTTTIEQFQPNFKPEPEVPTTCLATESPTVGCASAGQGIQVLLERLMRRINEASGPYQMFESLGDMVVFEKNASTATWSARYMEEVPLAHFHEVYKSSPRLTWVFRYADGFYGPAVFGPHRVGAQSFQAAHMSNFLHPRITFFPANSENFTKSHYLLEDIYTTWDSPEDHIPVGNFLNQVAKELVMG
eukprot:TRINITY_DN36889_c0_g1_i1.p1 TRINITY_DN36889_c0_g1~~TRINITY_DN36889_c0_g1_i1.p1  ORF type:complete len:733 (+),score=145.39 TRINITY_DN36889_c0_g1_i1:79-2277(+)